MPDYKEMYLHLMRETEHAVRILISAQQECEEIYLNSPEPKLVTLNQTALQESTQEPVQELPQEPQKGETGT